MRALAIIFGVILLLPGACSLIAMSYLGADAFRSFDALGGMLLLLWFVCLAVSAFGVFLIIRNSRSRGPD
jgi:hypothetical protein